MAGTAFFNLTVAAKKWVKEQTAKLPDVHRQEGSRHLFKKETEMYNKLRIPILLTLLSIGPTGCFRITEAILTGQPPKDTKVVPIVQATLVIQSRSNVPIYTEYHWWYTGYHNLPIPLTWTPLTRRWYHTGRQHWWMDNFEPRYWPRREYVITLEPRPEPEPIIIVQEPKPIVIELKPITERSTMIPRDTKAGIDRYVDGGVPTGSFLRAVLSNDLFEATMKADADNQLALADICQYIRHYTPHTCYGSPEAVANWIKFHRATPAEANCAAGGDRERRGHYYDQEHVQ